MKNSLVFCLLLFPICLLAQDKKIQPTDQFRVTGKIKTELVITLADLKSKSALPIGDVQITSHTGGYKSTAKNLKGVLLKDLLAPADFMADKPKALSSYIITCMASDGYTVVYSWNELFNTETGNHVFVVTEKDGIDIDNMDERILLISTTDFKSGRRYLKGLQKIIIQQLQ
jgi:hypothetical protein